jgi:hypothetical protein
MPPAPGDDFECTENRLAPLLALLLVFIIGLLMWAGIITGIIRVLRWL